jgi:hypothetical protein
MGDLDLDLIRGDDPCLYRTSADYGVFYCDTYHNGGNAEESITFGLTSTTTEWWKIPDYTGIRTTPESSDFWGNQVYIEYANLDKQPVVVDFVEHYDMRSDPRQTLNKRLVPAYAQSRQRLKGLLDLLRTCAGQVCRQVDGT